MKRSLLRAPMALLTALVTLWVPVAAQAQTSQPLVCQTVPATQVDNRDGYFVNLEEGPVEPLILLPSQKKVWAANFSDSELVVFNAANPFNLVPKATVKVALGPVSLVVRPPVTGPGEVWVVCQSSNAVVIVDRTSRRVLDSIRLTHEPAGLVFNAAGTKAWVSLAASNQVVEIDAATRTVAATLGFGTPFPDPISPLVHVEEPRSLLLDGADLYALSFEGGNGTLGLTGGIVDDTIINLWQFYNPAGNPPIPPPPDRDVLRFTVPGANPAAVALWRTGSINFDLAKDNAGKLWVSNVDYNNTLVGEFQFPGGAIAKHRVTHAPPLAQTTLTTTPTSCGNPVPLTATFQVVDETGAAVNGATVTFTQVEWTPGGGNLVTPLLTAGPTAGGLATAALSSTLTACTPGAKAEVFVTDVSGSEKTRAVMSLSGHAFRIPL